MAHISSSEDLVLHGVRVLGSPSAPRIADRFGLESAAVDELLLDFAARGWVRRFEFAGSSGWSLTDTGRREGERRLAAELDRAGARGAVAMAHVAFLPLNRRFGQAATEWQIRPTAHDRMAVNDHCDPGWDRRVLATLAELGRSFAALTDTLARSLTRFSGYAVRYCTALRKAEAGDVGWVDAPYRDSCHLVWIQFHEDLLATLGIPRGADT